MSVEMFQNTERRTACGLKCSALLVIECCFGRFQRLCTENERFQRSLDKCQELKQAEEVHAFVHTPTSVVEVDDSSDMHLSL